MSANNKRLSLNTDRYILRAGKPLSHVNDVRVIALGYDMSAIYVYLSASYKIIRAMITRFRLTFDAVNVLVQKYVFACEKILCAED